MNGNLLLHRVLNVLISLVWIINGFFCKVLNLVPRHHVIVARITGVEYAGLLTRLIGIAEVVMAVWILSSFKSRWCTVTQIAVVATMNTIEFFAVPDLLLFGRLNAIVALVFITAVYYNEFVVGKRTTIPAV